MILNKERSYIFYDIDRHGVYINPVSDMFGDKFTMLCRFTPDYDHIQKTLESRRDNSKFNRVFHKQCIVGKNGKHTGLFFTSLIDDSGDIVHTVEYEWWQNPLWEQNQSEDDDECKAIRFPVDPYQTDTFEVVVKKYDGVFEVTMNGKTQSLEYDCIIDYSKSFVWIGAANRLLDDSEAYDEGFACLYTGDISLLHMQETEMNQSDIDLCFTNFKSFRERGYNTKEDVLFISTDFSETTPYKARDFSGNGTHPLLYNPHWIG